MVLLNLPLDQIQLFLFVLVRVGAILFSIPFLDARNVPMMLKAGLAVAVSLLVIPQLSRSPLPLLNEPVSLALGLAGEMAIGLIIGFSVQLIFAGIQLAGQMAGFQMGFAIANVVDPASSLQIPILSQFLNLFGLLIFLVFNIHYYFVMAMVESFARIPLWSVHFHGDLFHLMMTLVANAFVVSVKVGAPVMVALLLTSVALGLVARTVPQMQIFIVAMPMKILLGLFFLGLSLPFCGSYLHDAFIALGRTLQVLIRLFI